ncbi:carboxypeptidase-like regulatory domain-containing protein [Saccharothrix sp. S26]|uniref:carboxypeptidase-like regulatory domain-containing protein n=1 Tax=Saccharothrix sp. S26 TaxID=2907215 RepID=UPI001F2BC8F5|nr:carboxypeptidase-like regulatory domain-containing protein [Saccharothrix sp. S26]MCE6993871.1 carboxypeptidase-like regulatory domain-containing protein [Saccharothrix sp. S26]
MRRAHLALLIGVLALGACGGEAPSSDADAPPPTTARATVTGVVTDSAGWPVDGALVQPRSLDAPPRPVPELAVLSGPDGRYEWHLTPGRYEFTATRDDRTGPPAEATTEAGRTDHLDLRLP